jgi:hypothetical protein
VNTPPDDRGLPEADPLESRLEQLLADRATQALSDDEWLELEGLLAAHPEVDPDAYDRTVAALEVSHQQEFPELVEPLPAHLRQRIAASGRICVRSQRLRQTPEPAGALPSRPAAERVPSRWLGLAAALLVGLTVGMLLENRGESSPERACAALLERRSPAELARAEWRAVEGESLPGIGGEVIWCDREQEGYLRLTGVPANDPAVEQYQLWIVDEDRGHAQPVDGGVFDVAAAAEMQTIPIDAALVVDRPGVFVITLEPKGGVPVSDGPFLATATIPRG